MEKLQTEKKCACFGVVHLLEVFTFEDCIIGSPGRGPLKRSPWPTSGPSPNG